METTELLQNQTQAHSLSISHVFSKHFETLFVNDCVEPEIIENLKISQGSSDESHVQYVSDLIKITSERQKVIDDCQTLREHLLWAQEKAMNDDDASKELNKDYEYLNLPPDESTFFKYINNDLLRNHGLIAPADVLTDVSEERSEMSLEKEPLTETNSSTRLTTKNTDVKSLKRKEFSLPPIEKPGSKEKPYKKKLNKDRKQISLSNDDCKSMFDVMTAKNNYLKNPRHLVPNGYNDSKEWLVPPNVDEEYQKMFLPIPESVEYTDYEVGKVYQKLVNFRNVTTVLRSIRVLPPKTRYFSLGLGQFPDEKGLVAAGMSCQFAIRFSPDSLGDYDDEIIVETQGGVSFPVKLIGRRPRPILTGSAVWNMEFCLIYGLKVLHYRIKNIGGPGKFCIADSITPPVSNSKAIIHSIQTSLEPFVIRPSSFELHANESINLELLFCPTSLGYVEKEFIIICDNCHSESFKIIGEGEISLITVENIEDGQSDPEVDEVTDISAQILLKFNSLNPFTYYQKTIVLKNESHTEIPFCWRIVKPHLKAPFSETDNSDLDALKNRTLDFDSAFIVEPPVGIFPPFESMPFTITFAPLEVKSYHSVFHLVLQGIPDFKPDPVVSTNFPTEGVTRQKSFNRNNENNFSETPKCLSPSSNKLGGISLNDITSLEIEVKGICIPLRVRFNTPSIIVPGELLINTPVRKQLQIINENSCPINLMWEKPCSEDFLFEIEPKAGLIDAEEIGVVDVCIVANKPGFFRDTLVCHIETLETPMLLVIEATFKGPELEIGTNDLDFGLVKVNDVVKKTFNIYNKSPINCSWRVRLGGCDDTELFEEIHFCPKSGVLGPLKNEALLVTFAPRSTKRVECGLEIALEHGPTKFLNVLACVQSPQVVLESASLTITGQLFVNTESIISATLCNHSHLESKFQWQDPTGENADHISILFDPRNGVIEPNGKMEVRLFATCTAQVEINIFLPCLVDGMEKPLILNISGVVLGPSLGYSVFDSIEASHCETQEGKCLDLNFGENVPIFEESTKYLLIENRTSIVTDFDISVDFFKTSSEYKEDSNRSVKRRPNLADRQSKPEKLAKFDFSKSMLKFKNGLAIGFKPSRGKLVGFGKVLIECTAYNDMWGQYNDFVRISGNAQSVLTDPIIIQMNIVVLGNPIEFTMTAGRKEQKPILRLGSKPFGEEPISRKIRLNNKSCCDIFVNWEMYSQIEDSDDKIIDLIVNVGDPFPLNVESSRSKNLSINIESDRSNDQNNFSESNATNSTRKVLEVVSDPLTLSERLDETSSFDNFSSNFITVIVRPHEGVPSLQPISFEPAQLFIPSESYGFVTVLYNPQYLQYSKEVHLDENEGIDLNNFLLGYLSLDKSNLELENRMLRVHQYEVKQIKLDITGRILLPSLQIDYPDADEIEEVYFSLPFSNLLTENKNEYCLAKTKSFTSHIILRNLKDTEIKFSLKTKWPFEVVVGKTNENEIKIGETLKVNIRFILNRDQLALLTDDSLFDCDDSLNIKIDNLLVSNDSARSAKVIQFTDVVTINYRNTEISQSIPIRAQIYFPEIVVSKSSLDFRSCFIGDIYTDHVRITNKSQSTSVVFLEIVDSPNSVFDLNTHCGKIPPPDSNYTDNKLEITIKFTPKQALEYNAVLRVTGIMGEEEMLIPISGIGSYDNQYQTH